MNNAELRATMLAVKSNMATVAKLKRATRERIKQIEAKQAARAEKTSAEQPRNQRVSKPSKAKPTLQPHQG